MHYIRKPFCLQEMGVRYDPEIQREFDSQVELIEELNEPNKHFLNLIQSTENPICLHLRRGDKKIIG